jgi:hypothetical protein
MNKPFDINLIDIIPKQFDIIQGPISAHCYFGQQQFTSMTILLFGDEHSLPPNIYIDKAINIIDLPLYLSKLMLLDLYVELPYDIINKKLGHQCEYFPDGYETNLPKIELKYLNKSIKNLRIHATDVRYRPEFIGHNNSILSLYLPLYNLYLMLYQYETDVIFDYITNDRFELIKKLLKTFDKQKIEDEMYKCFKIEKQRAKFFESHNYQFHVHEIDNLIHKWYDAKLCNLEINSIGFIKLIELLEKVNNVQQFIDLWCYENNKVSIMKFMWNFKCWIEFNMDLYTVYRLMRKFDDKLQQNVIVFAGQQHIININEIFSHLYKYFTSKYNYQLYQNGQLYDPSINKDYAYIQCVKIS